jgi:4a-hydroxytetrahydrobiopterin dehydratase
LEDDMTVLSREDIDRQIAGLSGWKYDGQAIVKQYKFSSFPTAIEFVNRLVPLAESADHHPDITINYSKVTLSYATHSEGGVTNKDFEGARAADKIAAH